MAAEGSLAKLAVDVASTSSRSGVAEPLSTLELLAVQLAESHQLSEEPVIAAEGSLAKLAVGASTSSRSGVAEPTAAPAAAVGLSTVEMPAATAVPSTTYFAKTVGEPSTTHMVAGEVALSTPSALPALSTSEPADHPVMAAARGMGKLTAGEQSSKKLAEADKFEDTPKTWHEWMKEADNATKEAQKEVSGECDAEKIEELLAKIAQAQYKERSTFYSVSRAKCTADREDVGAKYVVKLQENPVVATLDGIFSATNLDCEIAKAVVRGSSDGGRENVGCRRRSNRSSSGKNPKSGSKYCACRPKFPSRCCCQGVEEGYYSGFDCCVYGSYIVD